jgi:hypothetical protein
VLAAGQTNRAVAQDIYGDVTKRAKRNANLFALGRCEIEVGFGFLLDEGGSSFGWRLMCESYTTDGASCKQVIS